MEGGGEGGTHRERKREKEREKRETETEILRDIFLQTTEAMVKEDQQFAKQRKTKTKLK